MVCLTRRGWPNDRTHHAGRARDRGRARRRPRSPRCACPRLLARIGWRGRGRARGWRPGGGERGRRRSDAPLGADSLAIRQRAAHRGGSRGGDAVVIALDGAQRAARDALQSRACRRGVRRARRGCLHITHRHAGADHARLHRRLARAWRGGAGARGDQPAPHRGRSAARLAVSPRGAGRGQFPV